MKCFPKNLKPLLLAVVLAGVAISMSAQDNIRLKGKIYDALTSHELSEAKIKMRDSSGNVVDSASMRQNMFIERMDGNTPIFKVQYVFYLSVPKIEKDYVIEISSKGYEFTEFPYTLEKPGRREDSRNLPNIYVKRVRKVKELAEVTVKASKVKFYNKGDTIVYNADAFDLPEGSMLDALVKQLPGVEIREGGAIYVNGKYVESLLLNGRDFFKGNQRIMLGNLGAYMVKDIKVYDKLGRVGELMGKKAGDEEYVMDVNLKKDYMAGNMVHAEAGWGTHDRWLGKLFGLHYANNSRISVYANVNNINDSDKPAQYTMTMPSEPDRGLTRLYRGGIDYFADNPQHTFEVNGNADFSMRDRTANTDTYHTSFLPGGNVYDYTFSRPKFKDLTVTTTHKLTLKREKWTLDVKPSFSYNHDKSTDKSVYASFDREIEGIGVGEIEGMFSPKAEGLEDAFINRQINETKTKGHGFNAGFFTEFLFKVPKTSDVTSVWFETTYNDYRSDRDKVQDIRYADDLISDMIRKQIMHSVPNRSFMVNPGMKYYYSIKNGTTGFLYNFQHTDTKKSTDLFLINARMEGNDPVFDDADAVFDPMNSYTSREKKDTHFIRPFYLQNYYTGIGEFTLKLSPEFRFHHRKLDYHRGEISAMPTKNDFTIRIMDTYFHWRSKSNTSPMYADLRYSRTPRLASLVDMVDFRDTSDPLNIQEGNPDLKNSVSNGLELFVVFQPKRKAYSTLMLNYDWQENDIVRGYRYDSASGVRTFKAYNVSGNRHFGAKFTVSWPSGATPFSISNQTGYNYSIYADMVGYDEAPKRQKVMNNSVSENLYFHFRKGWFSYTLIGDLNYRHTKSDSREFRSFNAFDFGYGARLGVNFPIGLDIDTDITMKSRRGYSQPEMNDNRLFWNARASYSMLKGKLQLILHAHDILGKEKNLSYSVNGQGRTETRYQILPRYVMLTLQCRLDFKPKRLKAGNN